MAAERLDKKYIKKLEEGSGEKNTKKTKRTRRKQEKENVQS
jgi:hypothetical protein